MVRKQTQRPLYRWTRSRALVTEAAGLYVPVTRTATETFRLTERGPMGTVNGASSRCLIEEAETSLAQGWSLPYSWMGSPTHFAFETSAIFECEWIVAGLERKLPDIGSRLLCRIGRV